jgi:hypothetical protein
MESINSAELTLQFRFIKVGTPKKAELKKGEEKEISFESSSDGIRL